MQKLSSTDWDERYRAGDTPWDLSGPTPEFQRLAEEPWFPRKGNLLVPGGGRGYDAIFFAKRGLDVELVDFSPRALHDALELAAEEKAVLHAYCQDFFTLPLLPYHQERYDIFLEYTFFCAIDPELRPRYVETAAALLKPGGKLVALFFPLKMEKEGPPFVVSRAEVEQLFSPYFEIRLEEPKASVKPRAGNEFVGILTRKLSRP